MRAFWMAAALLAAGVGLHGCGGGGGGGGGAPPGTPAPLAARPASAYAGTFIGGTCEYTDGGTNLENGLQLFHRSQLTISDANGATARVTLRFDFHDNTACAGSPVGSLTYTAAANRLAIVGAAVVNGKTVDQVTLSLQAPDQAPTASAPGLSAFGTAIRLQVPSQLFAGVSIKDIWLPEGDKLFYGDDSTGPDGFPVSLDLSTADVKQTATPQPPASPCGEATATWVAGTNTCSAVLPASASGTAALLEDNASPTLGAASFSCSNGTWSAPANASCATAAPPPVVADGNCAAGSVTWTVNGNTCRGSTEFTPNGSFSLTSNTDAALMGVARYACNSGNMQLSYGTCEVRPPPPPPLTDPLQIAQQRNCIACHSVDNPAQSVAGISLRVIADHYRTNPPAAGVLADKVKRGGSGSFGSVPMPPNPQISDAELAIVIPWILSR